MQIQGSTVGKIVRAGLESSAHQLAEFKSAIPKRTLVIGGAIAGGALAAYVGYNMLHKAGGGGSGGSDGRDVGVAYGRKTITHADGTSEWANVTVPLLLARHVGAAEGYATLTQAIAAAKPNSGNGEIAFMREGAGVAAFTLDAPGLEAVSSFNATAPSVVAFTTRMSGQLYAGPAATAAERLENHLVDAPTPETFGTVLA